MDQAMLRVLKVVCWVLAGGAVIIYLAYRRQYIARLQEKYPDYYAQIGRPRWWLNDGASFWSMIASQRWLGKQKYPRPADDLLDQLRKTMAWAGGLLVFFLLIASYLH